MAGNAAGKADMEKDQGSELQAADAQEGDAQAADIQDADIEEIVEIAVDGQQVRVGQICSRMTEKEIRRVDRLTNYYFSKGKIATKTRSELIRYAVLYLHETTKLIFERKKYGGRE